MRLRVPLAPLVSVLLFAALCAICAAWALALLAPRSPVTPAGTIAQTGAPIDLRQASGLFGATPAQQADVAAAGPSDIQVHGVLAAGPRGVALLSVNGRPAKPFAVGDPVDTDTTVVAVSADAVRLSRKGQPVVAPAPKRPDLAILTSGPAPGAAGSAPQSPGSPVTGAMPAAGGAAPAFPPAANFLPAVPGAPPPPGTGRPAAGVPPPPPAPALAPTDPPLPAPDQPAAGGGLMPGRP